MSVVSERVKKILGMDGDTDKVSAKQIELGEKYGIGKSSYNPFLDKNGNLFNKYMNYQKILDNPKVTQTAKKYIMQATGFVPTQLETLSNEAKTTAKNVDGAGDVKHTSSSGNVNVGFISAKYESGGNGGSVSSGNGDYGGISYGVPQFSSKTGSADGFVSWLKQANPEMGNYFRNYKAGTSEFSNAWKKVYSKYGEEFSDVQTEYAYNNFVKPLADLAKSETGVDYTRSPALKELLYSTAIQFGSGSLGLSALGNVSPDMSDSDIINASYDRKIANYKNYFRSSSEAVQNSVRNRFVNERNDVLALVQ